MTNDNGIKRGYMCSGTVVKDDNAHSRCVDEQPPNDWNKNTCKKQSEAGNCKKDWFKKTGYCEKTCGKCTEDEENDRSIIMTAAHCVYDYKRKEFARDVFFIPNQADGGSKSDTDCDNDPLGCWVPSFGVVDEDWKIRSWPDNMPW